MIHPLPRTLLLSGALVAGFACTPTANAPTTQSGSLAISADGRQLYVADADNDELVIVDAAARQVKQAVKVGHMPTQVVAAKDGRLFVTNSQGRSVSVIDPGSARETSRITVGTEPTGLALSADGKTLLVTNTTNATVSVIDVPSLSVRSTIQTKGDPNGVAFMPDGRAYVTHLRSGEVSILEKESFKVARSFPLNVTLPTAIAAPNPRSPGQPTNPVLDPNGRVFIPHSQSDVSLIPTDPSEVPIEGGGGSAYAGGGDGFLIRPPVVAPAIATLDPSTDQILPGTEFGQAGTAIVPPTLLTVSNQPLAGPSAAVVDTSGRFLYVVHMYSNNVAVIGLVPTPSQEPTKDRAVVPGVAFGGSNVSQIVSVGAGPTGIAIPPSGDRAYVYNSFDHSISVIRSEGQTLKEVDVFKVGSTSLTPEQDLGRRLFFSAADSRMTSTAAGGVACASCHPGGRDDGRTWQFSEGPRNTPLLAGRHLQNTAPYHWDGALTTMHDFNMVITTRMGGVGDGSAGTRVADEKVSPLTDADFNAMLAFLDGLPQPQNPFRDAADPAAVERGRKVFNEKAACAGCHVEGNDFTDNGFHEVGTVAGSERFPMNGLVNTPTLHNLFASAPYLHDGSKWTLRERVLDDANGQHGVTAHLTREEVDDLVTYLQTL